jgi:hypothetical protein
MNSVLDLALGHLGAISLRAFPQAPPAVSETTPISSRR